MGGKRSKSKGKGRRSGSKGRLVKVISRVAKRLSHSPEPKTAKRYAHATSNIFAAAGSALRTLRRRSSSRSKRSSKTK